MKDLNVLVTTIVHIILHAKTKDVSTLAIVHHLLNVSSIIMFLLAVVHQDIQAIHQDHVN